MFVCIAVALTLECGAPQKGDAATEAVGAVPSEKVLVSTAFTDGDWIPWRYGAHCRNVSPDLSWDRVLEGFRSVALICRDPAALGRKFYHWVVFNMADGVRSLAEELDRTATLPSGGAQGMIGLPRVGYDGPKPPVGTHRYCFDLYALNGMLALDDTATAGRLLDAMKGHLLVQASLMGRSKRWQVRGVLARPRSSGPDPQNHKAGDQSE